MMKTDYQLSSTQYHTRDHKHTTWRLERASRHGAFTVTVMFDGTSADEPPRVLVKFEAPSIPYARAEAARLYAGACDTIGDYGFDGERLDLVPDSLVMDLVRPAPTVELFHDFEVG